MKQCCNPFFPFLCSSEAERDVRWSGSWEPFLVLNITKWHHRVLGMKFRNSKKQYLNIDKVMIRIQQYLLVLENELQQKIKASSEENKVPRTQSSWWLCRGYKWGPWVLTNCKKCYHFKVRCNLFHFPKFPLISAKIVHNSSSAPLQWLSATALFKH